MLSFFTNLFSGSTTSAIENIAKEWIETDTEKAEAKTIMLKALDPNGAMRRDISQTVKGLYKIYILTTMILLLAQAFELGDVEGLKLAITSLTDLFIPITAMFTAIVSASFGVNVANTVKQGKQ